jgi:hypothetical protein
MTGMGDLQEDVRPTGSASGTHPENCGVLRNAETIRPQVFMDSHRFD